MSQEIFRKYQIRAKKGLGQNFLVDEAILQEIASCVEIQGKNIVEVGPGYGALTEKILSHKPSSLHLVELDDDMIDILKDREHLGEFEIEDIDFQIEQQDVLNYVPTFQDYRVIANIPYYITSPILRHFLYEIEHRPENMLILMQQDVGDKILGKGKNKSSVLSLFIQKKCRVKQQIFVPKESFIPRPKIESSVIYFEIHNDFENIDDRKFMEVIKKGFLTPRKKLIKNLVMGGYPKEKILKFYKENDFSENLRGEDMDIEKWCKLIKFLK